MRIRLIGLVGSVALASAMATAAAVSTGDRRKPGSGGSNGGGGTGGTSAPNCPGGTPCGGSVRWNLDRDVIVSGPRRVTWTLRLASLGCTTVPVTGSLHVTGTWTANSNGTYTDNTVTTGSITFPLAPACLSVSSVNVACAKAAGAFTALGWASATCATDAGGHVQLLGDGQPERRYRRDLPLGDDQRQLHDLGLRAQRRLPSWITPTAPREAR